MKIADFSSIKVDNLSLEEAVDRVGEFLHDASLPHYIVTPNPEIIVAAQKDLALREIINAASLRVPDGVCLVVVSRLLGRPLKQRVSGIDLMLKIIEKYNKSGLKIFLLGGQPGVAQEAAGKLVKRYPGINIVGTQHGYFSDDIEVVEKIKSCKPDILFVGLGAGRQEMWLHNYRKNLNVPVSMVIGGSLDVISGRKKRAPKLFQALGIEWLYRLITEPSRWKRQLALPKFLWLMLVGRDCHRSNRD